MSTLTAERVPARGYEEVRLCQGARSGLTMAIAVHRTVGGRALGGCRFEPYETPEDALADAKRLAHSMTLKAAVAGLTLGGAKGVIAYEPNTAPQPAQRADALHDFAELVESFGGRYITAQDAGTTLEDIIQIGRFTDHIAGRPPAEGGSGDPSPYTAQGVEVAIRASINGPLEGRRISIIGLGHVGSELARRLHAAGAQLIVSDVDERKRGLARELDARWVAPDAALETEADLLAPCALGGMLNDDTIPNLRVAVVAGAGNNQLETDGAAQALRERGIVWAPDFVVNAGGLIAVADELHGFDPARVQRSIERIGDTLREIYARAGEAGMNTLTAAQELAAERFGGLDGDNI